MIHLGVFLSRLRKLPALIFWLVKDVYRYFKNHEGKHFHQWGLHIYLGKFGAGKTCSMVRDAYFICKRYPDVTIDLRRAEQGGRGFREAPGAWVLRKG